MANSAQFIYSPALTNYGIKAGVGTFGGAVGVAPVLRQPNYKGVYFERDRQKLGAADTKRAPGETYKQMEPAKGEMKPYVMSDYGIIKPVPEEFVYGYGANDLFGEKANAGLESLIEVRNAHAKAVRDATWAATESGFNAIYGAANVNVPATKWNAADNTIEANIAAAKERVRINCGYAANVIAMPQIVFDAITTNALSSVYDRIKYTSSQSLTKTTLAALLGVEEIIVFGELANSANAGVADVWGDLFTGDNVLVFYRNGLQVRDKMNLAQTFYFETPNSPFMSVEERFNTENKSYEMRASAYFEVKLTAASAGQVLFDVLT